MIAAKADLKESLSVEDPSILRVLFTLLINILSKERFEIAFAILRQFSVLVECVFENEYPFRRSCEWLASCNLPRFGRLLSDVLGT